MGLGVLCFTGGSPEQMAPLVEIYKETIADAEPVGDYVNDNVAITTQLPVPRGRRRGPRLDDAIRQRLPAQPACSGTSTRSRSPPGIPEWPDEIPDPTLEQIDGGHREGHGDRRHARRLRRGRAEVGRHRRRPADHGPVGQRLTLRASSRSRSSCSATRSSRSSTPTPRSPRRASAARPPSASACSEARSDGQQSSSWEPMTPGTLERPDDPELDRTRPHAPSGMAGRARSRGVGSRGGLPTSARDAPRPPRLVARGDRVAVDIGTGVIEGEVRAVSEELAVIRGPAGRLDLHLAPRRVARACHRTAPQWLAERPDHVGSLRARAARDRSVPHRRSRRYCWAWAEPIEGSLLVGADHVIVVGESGVEDVLASAPSGRSSFGRECVQATRPSATTAMTTAATAISSVTQAIASMRPTRRLVRRKSTNADASEVGRDPRQAILGRRLEIRGYRVPALEFPGEGSTVLVEVVEHRALSCLQCLGVGSHLGQVPELPCDPTFRRVRGLGGCERGVGRRGQLHDVCVDDLELVVEIDVRSVYPVERLREVHAFVFERLERRVDVRARCGDFGPHLVGSTR